MVDNVAELAAADYRAASQRLEREALIQAAAQRPLSARVMREYARIARNAARAEETDTGAKLS